MALRGDGSADYTQALLLFPKLGANVAKEDWSALTKDLGILSVFWPRATEWERTMFAAVGRDLPCAISTTSDLARDLAVILIPNVEHIRSVLAVDKINHEFFAWLDAILTAAGSDKAGQFMAPILAKQFMSDFIRLAQPLCDLIGTGSTDFVKYLLANRGQFGDFHNAEIQLAGVKGNADFVSSLFLQWLGDPVAQPFAK